MPEATVQQTAQHPDTAVSANADVVLGLLSFNSAETIRGAIDIAQTGLGTYFPGKNCVLIDADGGSKDGTPALALDAVTDKKDFVQISYPIAPVHKLSPEYLRRAREAECAPGDIQYGD